MFYVLLLAPILCQHIAVKGLDYEKKKRVTLKLFFAMLTMLVLLRHEKVGNDTRNYIATFKYYSSMKWGSLLNSSLELGFVYYNKLISLVTDDPRVFLAITAVITMALIYPTYRRLCCDPSLTIAIFCVMSTFAMLFSGIRQMLAIGIGMRAYECVRQKKLIPFLITSVLATMFHTSAFILLCMYPVFHMKTTKKSLRVIIPALAIIWILNRQIFTVLTTVLEKYTKYDGSISSTGAYTTLFLFAILAAVSFVIPSETKLDDETVGLRNLLLLAVAIQMFAPLHTLAMRMNYYYIIFIPLIVPKVFEARKDGLWKVAMAGRWALVLFFLAYFFTILAPSKVLHVFPYHFFWESGV